MPIFMISMYLGLFPNLIMMSALSQAFTYLARLGKVFCLFERASRLMKIFGNVCIQNILKLGSNS